MASKETEGASTASGSSQTSETATTPQQKPLSGHRARYAKVYNFFGFTRSYNFPLWIIFAGGMLGFSLSRLQFFNYDNIFAMNAAPGFMYNFSHGVTRVGMILHLAGALPAGVLMVLQFTPIIRHKLLLFHRINGYIVLFLLLVSNVAACMVIPHNHGHGASRIAAQTAEAFLIIVTTLGIAMAWWNIRRLQVDQHRAWMLRTMFYYGTIITERILNHAATAIISKMGGYYGVWTCDELDYVYTTYGMGELNADDYPHCFEPGATAQTPVVVNAALIPTAVEQTSESSTVALGSMLWITIVAHLIGVEIYLALTPRESERLRRVSYEKQLEAGYPQPGSAGLTSDRWGDAEPYKPR